MRSPRDATPKKVRCAIYTRKSTEEGLDQDFNSLDAQREACAAYILSQRHEGWELIPEYYDDGGYSGGNMDRPALRLLLSEIEAGKVDVIVVYKVDRLTRSLADFAKIVEVLDEAGASFVSVTQSFNTTTSMGRLTLNVLLSFAQFEREVTGERIRDKIAASKAKGMWMGGRVPLGYDLQDGALVANAEDAATVRKIFERYRELQSGPRLLAELQAEGITSKARPCKDGRIYGGKAISRGGLYTILQNRMYVGEMTHKDKVHVGQQPAIIERELFDAVQLTLAAARVARGRRDNANEVSPLAGLMVDAHERRMSPSHASKGSRRYRYYISQRDGTNSKVPVWRLSARDIEGLVRSILGDTIMTTTDRRIDSGDLGVDEILALRRSRDAAVIELERAEGSALLEMFRRFISKATVSQNEIVLAVTLSALGNAFEETETIQAAAPLQAIRTGDQIKLVVPPPTDPTARSPNRSLMKLVAQAMAAREELGSVGAVSSGKSRAYTISLARLSYLAPDVIRSILDGAQPRNLTRDKLMRIGNMPVRWDEQRALLGYS